MKYVFVVMMITRNPVVFESEKAAEEFMNANPGAVSMSKAVVN